MSRIGISVMSTHFLKHWPFTYVRLSTICETGLRSGILCSMILRKNIRPHLKSRSLKKFYDKNIDLFFFYHRIWKKRNIELKRFHCIIDVKVCLRPITQGSFSWGKSVNSYIPSGSDFEEEQKHLKSARKYGFSKGFSSLLAITGDAKAVVQ